MFHDPCVTCFDLLVAQRANTFCRLKDFQSLRWRELFARCATNKSKQVTSLFNFGKLAKDGVGASY